MVKSRRMASATQSSVKATFARRPSVSTSMPERRDLEGALCDRQRDRAMREPCRMDTETLPSRPLSSLPQGASVVAISMSSTGSLHQRIAHRPTGDPRLAARRFSILSTRCTEGSASHGALASDGGSFMARHTSCHRDF